MGRAANLSKEKRAQAVALSEAGRSQRQIAVQLSCSKTAVRNAIHRHGETGSYADRPGRGRPLISTRRQNRSLVRVAKREHHTTAPRLQAEWQQNYGVVASVSTVRRR